MTAETFEKRIAGRALDLEIAERIFGDVEAHAPCGDGLTRTDTFFGATLAECDDLIRQAYPQAIAAGTQFWPAQYIGPEYSTEIEHAFAVVEAMRAKAGRDGMVFGLDLNADEGVWAALFDMPHGHGSARGMANPALAICTAALAALDAETLSSQSVPTPSHSLGEPQ